MDQLKNPDHVERLIEGLSDRDQNAAYSCLLELIGISRKEKTVYEQFEQFEAMIRDKSSFVRVRGLLLIAANARWDEEKKIDRIISECLEHITDEKPTVSRQFIKALPELAAAKPKLRNQIVKALENADLSKYADTVRTLIKKDIETALSAVLDA